MGLGNCFSKVLCGLSSSTTESDSRAATSKDIEIELQQESKEAGSSGKTKLQEEDQAAEKEVDKEEEASSTEGNDFVAEATKVTVAISTAIDYEEPDVAIEDNQEKATTPPLSASEDFLIQNDGSGDEEEGGDFITSE